MKEEYRKGWDQHCKDFGIPLEVEPVDEVEAAIKKTNDYWVDLIIGLLPRSYNSPAMEMSRITQKINAELQKLEG